MQPCIHLDKKGIQSFGQDKQCLRYQSLYVAKRCRKVWRSELEVLSRFIVHYF